MPVTLEVPISTAVVEDNPRCLAGAEFADDIAVIRLDARKQNHHEILGLPKSTKLHWANEVRTYEAEELSSFPWPIRYRVTTGDAWYTDAEGERAHYSPPIFELDPHAKVSMQRSPTPCGGHRPGRGVSGLVRARSATRHRGCALVR